MALELSCIEYCFSPRTTSLASNTRFDFTAITLYIPENSSRTFRSVIVEITWHDADAGGSPPNITGSLIGIKLGAVAFNDQTYTDGLINSDPAFDLTYTRDVTSYFASNFGAGTSQTCQVGFKVTGPTSINITAKLIITYEFQGTGQTTRVKTVRIPIESTTTKLTTSLAEIGTNQIPNLDTFLPESSKTYRQNFFEIYLQGEDTTTDWVLELALDAESGIATGAFEQNTQTLRTVTWHWIRDDMTTNATHAFKARTTGVAAGYCTGGFLIVTYEYDSSASTTIMNSLMIPLKRDDTGLIGKDDAANQDRLYHYLAIQEPATITLVQSAVLFTVFSRAGAGAIGAVVKAGSQSTRNYSPASTDTNQAPSRIVHRVDSGGAAGSAGLTLARGEASKIIFDMYSDGANIVTCAAGMLVLNYTSGKHASGVGVHNKTTIWHIKSFEQTEAQYTEASATAPNVPPTNFKVTSLGFRLMSTIRYQGGSVAMLKAEILSGELEGDGWLSLGFGLIHRFDTGSLDICFSASHLFERWAGDPDTNRLDVEGSRKYRLEAVIAGAFMAAQLILVHHAITSTVTGNITGFSGDGSGITVDVHTKNGIRTFLGAATSAVGGAYSLTVFDDTISYKSDARQSASLTGRSDDGAAT